jgi:cysteine-rich repeat protein
MKQIALGERWIRTRVFGCCCSAALALVFLMSTPTASRALTNLCSGGSPNGVIDPNEQCDDNNPNNIDDCTNDCTISVCGDGTLHTQHSSPPVAGAGALEQCDNGLSYCSAASVNKGQVCSSNADCQGKCSGGSNNNYPCTAATAASDCAGAPCNLTNVFCGDQGNNNDPGTAGTCRTNCLPQRCGDGITDTAMGEQCDDGNTVNGDGCDNNCTPSVIGGQPNCGNGIVDPGEDCDWGDNVKAPCAGPVSGANKECNGNNTGCTKTCKFATCGDGFACTDVIGCTAANTGGHLSHTEQCDNFGADSATCNGSTAASLGVDCMTSKCGDKYINTAALETCDDGNTVSGDGCTGTDAHPGLNNCVKESCGDGIANNGEECDWGMSGGPNGCNGPAGRCNDNSHGCTASCLWAKCGDKKVCTDATTCTAATTNNNLTGPEQCDGGYAAGDDSHVCLSNCKNASCGDNHLCSDPVTCKLETITTGPTCSVTHPCKGPETCDDGNTNDADGCTQSCQSSACGDGVVDAPNEQCDNGQSLCTAGPDTGQPCNTAASCEGVCSTNGAPCTLANAGTVCGDAAACNSPSPGSCGPPFNGSGNRDDVADACRHTCKKAACGDGTLDSAENCDSGKLDSNGPCVVTNVGGVPNLTAGPAENCKFATCGDGFVCNETGCTTGPNGGLEACDNGTGKCNAASTNAGHACTKDANCFGTGAACVGNSNNPNACRPNCASPTCGDGITDSTEQCDWGDGAHGPCTGPGAACNSDTAPNACRTTCTKASCGDGVTDTGEACDTGTASTTGTCIITKLSGLPNTDPSKGPLNCATASCGDGYTCSDANCTTGPGGRPEVCDNGPAVLGCDGGGTMPAGTPCVVDSNCGPGGECVWVDPFPGNCSMSPMVCQDGNNKGQPCTENADCPGSSCISNTHQCGTVKCGNGIIDPGEECDDGNTLGGDGCDPNCQIETCGNGLLQPLNCPIVGGVPKCEQCDFGAGPTGCTGPFGACNGSKAGCNGICQAEFCGDGITNDNPYPMYYVNEQCDWGDGSHGPCTGPGGACNSDTAPSACRTYCWKAYCGDGVTDNGESCDTGGWDTGPENTGCNGATCTFAMCGDGYLNNAAGEQCDDGTGKCNATSTNSGAACTYDGDCTGTGAQCVGNSNNSDTCRPNCQLPKCGDGITDPGRGETCDGGPTGSATCTTSCCYKGDPAVPHWQLGFLGSRCQLNTALPPAVTACQFTSCNRGGKTLQRIYTMRLNTFIKSLGRAQQRATLGQTFQAMGTVHSVQNQSLTVINYVRNQCPQEVTDCVTIQLQTQLGEILTNLQGALALNQP